MTSNGPRRKSASEIFSDATDSARRVLGDQADEYIETATPIFEEQLSRSSADAQRFAVGEAAEFGAAERGEDIPVLVDAVSPRDPPSEPEDLAAFAA